MTLPRKSPLPSFNALDLERHITVPEAAEIKRIHPETFEKHYGHLIQKVSPRCRRVKLRDLLEDQETTTAA